VVSREQGEKPLVRDEQLRAEEWAKERSRRQKEVQRRREEGAVASVAKKATSAEKRAARAKKKVNKMAQKQLENQSSASN
jgi:hypothetical protein